MGPGVFVWRVSGGENKLRNLIRPGGHLRHHGHIDANQCSDYSRRQRIGKDINEIDGLAGLLGHFVGDHIGNADHVNAHFFNFARLKRLLKNLAQAGVGRWVLEDHPTAQNAC